MKVHSWKKGAALALACVAVGVWQGFGVGLGTVPSASPTLPAEVTNSGPAVAIQPARIALPPDLAQVVQLAQAGLGDDVLIAYIQKTSPGSPLTPGQILYLRDLGISSRVLTALLERRSLEQARADAEAAAQMDVPTEPELTGPGDVPPPADEAAAGEAPADMSVDSGSADYGGFYGALAPYGNWMNFPGCGWCWQPMVCSLNRWWQPYCDNGRWLWSDRGWYWNSRYSWGWGPFHYGRWWRHAQYGWLWRPESQWAPAWVAWRQSSDYCGWAPLPPKRDIGLAVGMGWGANWIRPQRGFNSADAGLAVGLGLAANRKWIVPELGFNPPDAGLAVGLGWAANQRWLIPQNAALELASSAFTFVAPAFLTDPQLSAHRLDSASAREIFGRSRILGGLALGPGACLFNRGIEPSRIEAATHQPIPPVPVRELAAAQAQASPRRATSGAIASFGEGLAIRPAIRLARGPTGTTMLIRDPSAFVRPVGPSDVAPAGAFIGPASPSVALSPTVPLAPSISSAPRALSAPSAASVSPAHLSPAGRAGASKR